MKMPGVEVGVAVIDYELDHVVVLYYDGVYLAVDYGVGGEVAANCLGGVEGRHLLVEVCLAVNGEAERS